jgi:hypothetical protein
MKAQVNALSCDMPTPVYRAAARASPTRPRRFGPEIWTTLNSRLECRQAREIARKNCLIGARLPESGGNT